MSMLAEPRRKQKVINLRAKNNAWSNDSNKFGQKMLEKMGWSSGKGLGAKENGIVEHVVAKYKNDEKGLGYEDKNDQWTKHEDDFNALLANLSNDDKATDTLHSGISLEKKSKKSKARIHYHKFTRGKDLSRYSEKDLANIFGKKSFKEIKVEESVKEDIKTTEQVFTDKGNMDDYFKTKLAMFKSKLGNKPANTNNEDDVSDCTFRGFSICDEVNSESIYDEVESLHIMQNGDVDNDNQYVELTSCPDIKSNKIKKKKKSKKRDGITSDTENEAEELISDCIQGTNEEIITDVAPSKERKSKKKKHEDCDGKIPVVDEKNNQKKKNKHKNHIEKTEEELLFMEDNIPKKKKKRKHQ